MTAMDRFEAKVVKRGPDECWEWQASKGHAGHGYFRFDGRTDYAHRFAAQHWAGLDIGGQVVRHLCNNPGCQNPAHLAAGTQADNIADATDAQRHAFGERNGHAVLSDETVLLLRALYKTGDYSLRYLARGFGVSYEGVRKAINGMNWKHLEMYS